MTEIGFPTTKVEDEERDKPLLIIPREIDDQLLSYARAVDIEVSGLGCIVEEGGIFRITEVHLPTQEGSPASTDLDKGAIAKWIKKRGTGEGINLWWHSHAGMDVFESLTDEETAGETLKLFSGEWMISVIINKIGQRLAILYLRSPVSLSVGLDIQVDSPLNPQSKKWRREAKRKVREEKIVVRTYSPTTGQGRLPGGMKKIKDKRDFNLEYYPPGSCAYCGSPVVIGEDACNVCKGYKKYEN